MFPDYVNSSLAQEDQVELTGFRYFMLGPNLSGYAVTDNTAT